MSGIVTAVLLSLLSAAGYALAAVAQSRLARATAPGRRGLRSLAARPLWWWAVALNAAAALAHVGALHHGPLVLVQPLGALTLVAALPLAARQARRPVHRTEWRGALATLAGLGALVAVTGPTPPGESLSAAESLGVAAAAALLITALARGRGLGYATASGIASGVASALTQTVTAAVAAGGAAGSVWWVTALVAAFAAGGLLLSQAAYRVGLAAPLAVVNLANPATAAVIGVLLLGETFRMGAWGWLVAVGAAALAARGVVLLSRGTARAAVTPVGARPEGAREARSGDAGAPPLPPPVAAG
ncbi:DMT family transporter [Streptomyces sp. NPDC006984]|uniref:DMT family transporter n=1 Tax=Streptomyces sp. NPDC006984 TaxID=3155463 RepID=UPI0033F973E0